MQHLTEKKLQVGIEEVFVRGFRLAVAGGERPSHGHFEGAFARGFDAGEAAMLLAGHAAMKYAEHVIKSPAMVQARENAESGVRS